MNALVIDTETGSLNAATGALLDLAAVELCDGEIGRTFRRRVLPLEGLVIEAEATACNGYSPERWTELRAVSEAEALADFGAFVEELRGPEGAEPAPRLIWAGHNTPFDRRFVSEAFDRVGLALPLRTWFSHRDIDLMHLAAIPQAAGLVSGRSLDELRRGLLDIVPGVHDALSDALDTARLLLMFERRIQWVDG